MTIDRFFSFRRAIADTLKIKTKKRERYRWNSFTCFISLEIIAEVTTINNYCLSDKSTILEVVYDSEGVRLQL